MTTSLEQMQQLVATFSNQMETSNHKFLTDLHRMLEEDTSLTDKQRFKRFTYYIDVSYCAWKEGWRGAQTIEEIPYELWERYNIKGLQPPYPPDEIDDMFKALEKAMMNAMDESCRQELQLPEELKFFLLCATFVSDPDFHRDRVSMFGTNISAHEVEHVVMGPAMVYEETGLSESDAEVIAGFVVNDDMHKILMHYVYCRPKVEDERQKEWGWRVMVDEMNCYDSPMLFDSIQNFLGWYGGWYDRVEWSSIRRALFEGYLVFNKDDDEDD